MRITFCYILLLIVITDASAQKGETVTIHHPNITFASVDRAGDLYLLSSNSVTKFDSKGNRLATANSDSLSSFDTGNNVRLIGYHRESRSVEIFNPTLDRIGELSIDNSMAISPMLVCARGDYNLVVLDSADWSLKTIDTRTATVISDIALNRKISDTPSYMKEYQGFLFIQTKSGILVYNSLGLQLRIIPIPAGSTFNFLGEELYYKDQDILKFIDLFSMEERSMPLSEPSTMASIITDTTLFAVFSDKVMIEQL